MNIYVAHSRKFDFQNELYKPIRQSALNDKHNFVLPHEISGEPFNSRVFLKNECDLALAEVSRVSTGLGIELGWADAFGVRIICAYQKSYEPNRSLTAVCQSWLKYSDSHDLILGIENAIRQQPNQK